MKEHYLEISEKELESINGGIFLMLLGTATGIIAIKIICESVSGAYQNGYDDAMNQ